MPQLSLVRDELIGEIGHFRGWGRKALSAYDSGQQVDLLMVYKSALRQFYYPIPAGGIAHQWRFLRPVRADTLWMARTAAAANIESKNYATGPPAVTTITMKSAWTQRFNASMLWLNVTFASGTAYQIMTVTSTLVVVVSGNAGAEAGGFTITAGDYTLPADFGGLVGQITYTETTPYGPLRTTGEGNIRALRQEGVSPTGRPALAAVRPLARNDAAATQRYQCCIWPLPDADYAVAYAMTLQPAVFEAAEYPYGGDVHAETILASCLAVAEQRLNDESGLWTAKFQERLAASIALDREMNTPDFYGRLSSSGGAASFDRAPYTTYQNVLPT